MGARQRVLWTNTRIERQLFSQLHVFMNLRNWISHIHTLTWRWHNRNVCGTLSHYYILFFLLTLNQIFWEFVTNEPYSLRFGERQPKPLGICISYSSIILLVTMHTVGNCQTTILCFVFPFGKMLLDSTATECRFIFGNHCYYRLRHALNSRMLICIEDFGCVNSFGEKPLYTLCTHIASHHDCCYHL